MYTQLTPEQKQLMKKTINIKIVFITCCLGVSTFLLCLSIIKQADRQIRAILDLITLTLFYLLGRTLRKRAKQVNAERSK